MASRAAMNSRRQGLCPKAISFLIFLLADFIEAAPFPNQAEFHSLNSTLGGSLKVGVPLALPCYSNYNGVEVTPNTTQCSIVEANYLSASYIASNFGGFENTNWGFCQSLGQECGLNFSSPSSPIPASSECYQGSVPSYYIPVQKVEDVQAALAFTAGTSVPFVIKNSGHDYKGRSSGPGSLALWMYTYKPAITLTKGFVPEGCSEASGKEP